MGDAATRINELDTVALKAAMPAHRLDVGALGTVIHVLEDGRMLEVEFAAADGSRSTTLTVPAAEVRRSTGEDA
jgi:hypothetical protein